MNFLHISDRLIMYSSLTLFPIALLTPAVLRLERSRYDGTFVGGSLSEIFYHKRTTICQPWTPKPVASRSSFRRRSQNSMSRSQDGRLSRTKWWNDFEDVHRISFTAKCQRTPPCSMRVMFASPHTTETKLARREQLVSSI